MIDEQFKIIVANVNPGPVLTKFEPSTPDGARFSKEENPYKQMDVGRKAWQDIMQIGGCPVDETVETIFRVAHEKNPNFWNPTNKDVHDAFAKIYKDPTGNSCLSNIPAKAPEITFT